MNRIVIVFLAVAASLSFVGCYNDFDTPGPAKVWTDADFDSSEIISIRELKDIFEAKYPGTNGIGQSMTITDDLVIRGKVISSDQAGNVYKSMYLYDADGEAAIEVKVTSGYYITYAPGRLVYVRLQGLTLGNYRTMLSIGVESTSAEYANGNIEDRNMLDEHLKLGELVGLTKADTLVVTPATYSSLTDASLGRLMRFEGMESKFGKAGWGFKNTFPNYFANSTSYDANSSPQWADVVKNATWAYKGEESVGDGQKTVFYYGSAWFTYGDVNTLAGNYVVRSSGYCRFRDNKVPVDGSKVNITALYTKFSTGSDATAAYQLLLNKANDVEPASN